MLKNWKLTYSYPIAVMVVSLLFTGCIFGSDKVFEDNDSKITWQASPEGDTYNWFEAVGQDNAFFNKKKLDMCGELEYAGFKDWRLPTINELADLVIKGDPPKIRGNIDLGAVTYWSSSRKTVDRSWIYNFEIFKTDYHSHSAKNGVVCVRSNQ